MNMSKANGLSRFEQVDLRVKSGESVSAACAHVGFSSAGYYARRISEKKKAAATPAKAKALKREKRGPRLITIEAAPVAQSHDLVFAFYGSPLAIARLTKDLK